MWQSVLQLGDSGINLGKAARYIIRGDWGGVETLNFAYRECMKSVPIVLVAATFIGMALSLQIARELVMTYGASRFVGGMIAVAIVREIGPVFAAVGIAGNVGSSIAAEIGSMKVTEQVDALQVFNIDPIRYLVVPRLIATTIMTPLLGILGSAGAILAGLAVTHFMVDIPTGIFLDSVQSTLGVKDIAVMLLKSTCFGVAIGIVGCSFGLNTQGGAEAVGNATTQAVVWGLLSIFFINYLVTSLFFGIGI